MCEINAYVNKGGKEELLLKDVAFLNVNDGVLNLKDIYGGQEKIFAKIKEIDFIKHKLILIPD